MAELDDVWRQRPPVCANSAVEVLPLIPDKDTDLLASMQSAALLYFVSSGKKILAGVAYHSIAL